MSEKKTLVTLEFDLESNRFVGSSDAITDSDKDISRRIINSLSRTFSDISSAWIKEFEEKVSSGVNRPGFLRHFPGLVNVASQTLPVTADC